MNSTTRLATKTRSGCIYRRAELSPYSTAIDRDLKTLAKSKILNKVGPGLYYRPKKTRFGLLPPSDKALVRAFLKGGRFLLVSPSDYTMLGLGITQTYNEQIVLNEKRHAVIVLNGRTFRFVRPPAFPNKLSKEYLLVDLMNRIECLAEDIEDIKCRVKANLSNFDAKKLALTAQRYGKVRTKKFFSELLCLSMN